MTPSDELREALTRAHELLGTEAESPRQPGNGIEGDGYHTHVYEEELARFYLARMLRERIAEFLDIREDWD